MVTATPWSRLCGPPGPDWTGADNLSATEIRSSDRPALIESLDRLSYPGPLCLNLGIIVIIIIIIIIYVII